MRSPKSLRSFVETLTDRDFETMRKLFASDVRLRALVPAGLKESDGPASVVDRFRSWFGSAQQFEVVESRVERVADRWHVAYRLLIERGNGRELVEQHVFCDVGADGIEKIDLVCSGFRPEPSSQRSVHEFDGALPGRTHRFDADDMGCADGLAGEFKTWIRSVDVGDFVEVIARDPAAKEDLPSLARLMGNTVRSVETLSDGRLLISVERGK